MLPTSASNLSTLTLDVQKAGYRLSVGRNNQAIPLRLLLDDTFQNIPLIAEGRRLQGKSPLGLKGVTKADLVSFLIFDR
jgi:hypothetical protein